MAKQRREFEEISALDFFPSDARSSAEATLVQAEAKLQALAFASSTGNPSTDKHRGAYRKRLWVSRKPLWIDRIACAWLIKRFIDVESSLAWIEKDGPVPSSSITFGFDGANFSDGQGESTFQKLVRNFELAGDASLSKFSMLIQSVSSGELRVPEAAGVEILIEGARRRALNADDFFKECEKTLDLLYEAYSDARH
jgi:hypothetical protein